MNRAYLIDYENVAESGLKGLFDIGNDDSAYIFYTDKSNKISFDFLKKFSTESQCRKIKFLKSASGKNALDFQLSSFLGALIERNGIEDCEYVIISKDNGFGCLSSFWKKEKPGIKIVFAASITQATNETDGKEVPVPDEAATDSSAKQDTEDSAASPPTQKQPQKVKQLTSQERSALHTAVQQKMSNAKYDAKTIGEVASFSNEAYKENKGKKEIYTWLIKKYKRDKGLEIYNVIKPVLK